MCIYVYLYTFCALLCIFCLWSIISISRTSHLATACVINLLFFTFLVYHFVSCDSVCYPSACHCVIKNTRIKKTRWGGGGDGGPSAILKYSQALKFHMSWPTDWQPIQPNRNARPSIQANLSSFCPAIQVIHLGFGSFRINAWIIPLYNLLIIAGISYISLWAAVPTASPLHNERNIS